MSVSPDQSSLTLGFLSPHNPHDRRAFSGSVHFAARALETAPGVRLRILGDHRPPRPLLDRVLKRTRAIDMARLDIAGLDAVVGLVATPLLAELADRHPTLPLFHVTDATPRYLRDAYGWQVPPEADTLERRVAAAARATIYSSDVIAARAPGDLDLPTLIPAVVPFGVNIERLPALCPDKPAFERLNLLFVGLDWVRKGGDIAVATLDALAAEGRQAHLTIIGTCPDRHRGRADITHLGYLDKNRRRDAVKIARAYRAAHLLLLPSRADCTPMVLTEAMAHGTPVIATDTGGVGTLIRVSGGGRLMPEFASPRDWARAILDVTDDDLGYALLADAGFDHVRTRASWAHWAMGIAGIVRSRLSGNVHYIQDSSAA